MAKPPLRFWLWNRYALASSGCSDTLFEFANYGVEDSASQLAGHWYLWLAGWHDPGVNGCPASLGPPFVTTVEISFVDSRNMFEGTEDHRAWYLISAVDQTDGFGYDLGRARGANLTNPALDPCLNPEDCVCGPRDIPARLVPGLTIQERTADARPCRGDLTPTLVPASGALFDVHIELEDPAPPYYTEIGRDAAGTRLIDGFEILGWNAVAPPTTSQICSAWTRQALVPYGSRGPITISLPSNGIPWYLATRIIYNDCSANGPSLLDGSSLSSPCAGPCQTARPGTDGILGTPVSHHCGPVIGI